MSSAVYEVNLTIQAEIYDNFMMWLPGHAELVAEATGFTGFKIFKIETDNESLQVCCHYYAENREAIELYLNQDAAKLRQHGLDAFGDRFSATRRILIGA